MIQRSSKRMKIMSSLVMLPVRLVPECLPWAAYRATGVDTVTLWALIGTACYYSSTWNFILINSPLRFDATAMDDGVPITQCSLFVSIRSPSATIYQYIYVWSAGIEPRGNKMGFFRHRNDKDKCAQSVYKPIIVWTGISLLSALEGRHVSDITCGYSSANMQLNLLSRVMAITLAIISQLAVATPVPNDAPPTELECKRCARILFIRLILPCSKQWSWARRRIFVSHEPYK